MTPGKGMEDPQLETPLLADQKPRAVTSVQRNNRWDRGLLCCLGDCDVTGVGVCILGDRCPCFLFGCA